MSFRRKGRHACLAMVVWARRDRCSSHRHVAIALVLVTDALQSLLPSSRCCAAHLRH